jgi:hypothetical protein
LSNGKWVLVGGRDFEAEKTGEGKNLEKCELLEVYSDLDKERLKALGGFNEFIARDNTFVAVSGGSAENDFEFSDNAGEDEYNSLMNELKGPAPKQISLESIQDEAEGDEEEIDADEAEALDAIDRGDYDSARTSYQKLLARKPTDVYAKIGLAQVELLARVKGLDFNAVRAEAAAKPEDVDAQIRCADVDMVGGHLEDAILRLVDVVRATSGAERAKVKDHLISLFDLVDPSDPRIVKGRTSLANALF